MKRFLILTIIIFSFGLLKAQDDRAKVLFDDAIFYFYENDYEEALVYLVQLERMKKDNANTSYMMGVSYLVSGLDKKKSVEYLERASAEITNDYKEGSIKEERAPIEVLLYLGDAYLIQNDIESSTKAYNKFKSSLTEDVSEYEEYMLTVNRKLETIENVKAIKRLSVDVNQERIADAKINTELAEMNPVVAGNGSMLAYNSVQKFYKGIFYCKNENGKWGAPQNFNFEVRLTGSLRASSLSYDGKKMILFKDDMGIGNLYMSTYNEKWGEVTKLDICTRSLERNGCLSKDGKTLIFSSNRKGGSGGLDLYSTTLEDNGKWSNPVNLGPTINTEFDEDFPVLLEDDKTLYFSSQGHYNMGGLDLFVSIKMADGTWSSPVNLGYPLSTTDDDKSFYPFNNGEEAYMNIYEDFNVNKSDIYKIGLKKSTDGKNVVLKGKLKFDEGKILSDKVLITIIEEGKEVGKTNPDTKTGEFSVSVPSGKMVITTSIDGKKEVTEELDLPKVYYTGTFNFELDVNAKDALFKSEETVVAATVPEVIPETKTTVSTSSETSTPVTTAPKTGQVEISNILFGFNKHTTEEYKSNLDKLSDYLKNNPGARIEVGGYADLQGKAEYNKLLTKRRADFVKEYLVSKGADAAAITTKGYGEENQISIDRNPETRKYNRRAEFKVIKQGSQSLVVKPVAVPEEYKL